MLQHHLVQFWLGLGSEEPSLSSKAGLGSLTPTIIKHDSTLAEWGGVYEMLEETYERTGGICCVDSAFQANNAAYLMKSAQDTTKAKTAQELIQIQQATSL